MQQSTSSFYDPPPKGLIARRFWALAGIVLVIAGGAALWTCVKTSRDARWEDEQNHKQVTSAAEQLAKSPPSGVQEGQSVPVGHFDYWGHPMTARFYFKFESTRAVVTSKHRDLESDRDDISAEAVEYHVGQSIEEAGRRAAKGVAEGAIEGVGEGLRKTFGSKRKPTSQEAP